MLLRVYWPILLITLLGGVFRFTNLNWDAGGRLHPDEALIVNGALTVRFISHLFPGFHDYNGFSVYLLRIISLIYFGFLGSLTSLNSFEKITLVGRFISASISTLTIPLIFVLGKKLWNREVGIFAALLFTFMPLSVQLAHFYTTESILIFLFTLLILVSYEFYRTPSFSKAVATGILSGLLIATKNTAYLFLPIPLIIIFWRSKNLKILALLFLIIPVSFFLASPFSFLDLSGYLERSKYLSDVVSGNLLFDWTLQFQKTGIIFWLANLFSGTGLVGIIGLIGSIYIFFINDEKNKFMLKIFALFTIGFALFLSTTYIKFIRYDALLLPFLIIFSALFLWRFHKLLLGKVILSIVLVSQIIWGTMFFHIYLAPHTTLAAGDWIIKNIPMHSVILTEYWNSIIRFERPELAVKSYKLINFNFLSPESSAKAAELQKDLATADYFVIESPKIQNTILRLQSNYPDTAKFYKDLSINYSEFKLVAEFSNYPRLGRLLFNDEAAEETFTVFDHPTVRIYKILK